MSDPSTWLEQLTLDEKCQLVAGASNWRTPPVERLGIPALKMTDGPNGARGEGNIDESTPGVVVPVSIAQGASWDPGLVGEIGDLLGREARRRSSHVLLAPGVNLHRTPIGGRTFEYFSEDPELTARLAAAYVRGVQSHEVAVTVKHFVGNDTEIDRMTVNVEVDERVLRELYLRPFEACVEAGAWAIMSAYNRLNGTFCGANPELLRGILRDEWGFDGAVISDWFGAHDTVESANGGLSIEMPGPPRVFGEHLVAAVERGDVDEATVDTMVTDVLRLIERTHAVERSADEPEESADVPAERALCRRAAIAGTVLAKNEVLAKNQGRVLPIDPASQPRAAVIGPNAEATRILGGGSSALQPLSSRSIVDALRDHFPDLVHEPGVSIDRGTPLVPLDRWVGPDGEPGLVLQIYEGLDRAREPLHTRRSHGLIRYFGSLPEGVTVPFRITLTGSYLPATTGDHDFGLVTTGRPATRVGGIELTRAGEELPRGDAFFGNGSAEQLVTVTANEGVPIPVEFDLEVRGPFAAIRLGARPPADEEAFDRAVAAATEADLAIVVVGTNDEWETEGYDRDTIALPGRQDDLVEAVAAVNDRTVVVVNAGAPIAMPWADRVGAIVLPFFGGMEMGDAVADVLVGAADPGGRLPITFPHRLEDSPAWAHYQPVDGTQRYDEGFDMGYRGHVRHDVAPLFPFGHGLSYGETIWGAPTASAATIPADGHVTVTVPVTAPDRDATVVVQGYVRPIDPPVEREAMALRSWAKAVVTAGSTLEFTLDFGPDQFRRWDNSSQRWVVDPGRYEILIAASAIDVRHVMAVEVVAP